MPQAEETGERPASKTIVKRVQVQASRLSSDNTERGGPGRTGEVHPPSKREVGFMT